MELRRAGVVEWRFTKGDETLVLPLRPLSNHRRSPRHTQPMDRSEGSWRQPAEAGAAQPRLSRGQRRRRNISDGKFVHCRVIQQFTRGYLVRLQARRASTAAICIAGAARMLLARKLSEQMRQKEQIQ